ncbi:hypothetical protein SERLA73DRAFT_103755 [Serpula lacrymans var. lacrymans S7.3]|uniref:HIG1 domain-containing protein n=2 Tax=Serpula lacrymans var. lacrymans TaxID=341189 RepID=F8PNN6_SERL3|nr:uncharacterized protein SERLADRAFT_460744 [Serpula lacrymans var. lacrymans S7.9]EGO01763.1 hypothetical protein SERLA73DRAFT_103755 [Serpula lacrymans var. lacrymans S7.3]EGO27401.1 hypothetical protein SERLADRAFT_460744 [Serpula lacrymans var. lacrymans S7.9]
MSDRTRLRSDVDKAYDIQVKAATKGAARSTGVGLSLVTLAHYTWPLFRRQTLAFKAFLVSGFTMFGLVIGADNALLSHEAERRRSENAIRREARLELARRGLVGTETEIAKWRAERAELENIRRSSPPSSSHE